MYGVFGFIMYAYASLFWWPKWDLCEQKKPLIAQSSRIVCTTCTYIYTQTYTVRNETSAMRKRHPHTENSAQKRWNTTDTCSALLLTPSVRYDVHKMDKDLAEARSSIRTMENQLVESSSVVQTRSKAREWVHRFVFYVWHDPDLSISTRCSQTFRTHLASTQTYSLYA